MDNALWLVNAMSPARTSLADLTGKKVSIDYLLVGKAQGRDVNAFATKNRGTYICAIHEGFYLASMDLAYGVMSDPGFCPNLGDPSLERAHNGEAAFGRRLLEGMRPHDILPGCPRRKQIADFVVIMMSTFALLHEEAHVVRGHVGATHEMARLPVLSEADLARGTEDIPQLLSQMIEQEADLSAILTFFSPLWLEIVFKNYCETTDITEQDAARLMWISLALVGGLIFFSDPSAWRRVGDTRIWGSHLASIFRARELAFPTTALEQLRTARWTDPRYKPVFEGLLSAFEDLEALGGRDEKFLVFKGLLPPDLDALAHRWNGSAAAYKDDLANPVYAEFLRLRAKYALTPNRTQTQRA